MYPKALHLPFIEVAHNDAEVLTKNGVFWDVTPCGSCKNRREELSPPSIMVTRIDELGTTLAVTSNRRKPLGISSQRASVASYS
jgi:hypothetical protein